MPKKIRGKETSEDLLRDILIVQLGGVGVAQRAIREIVGVDIHRVNRILKHFPKKGEKRNESR